MLLDLWERATTTQPALSWQASLLLGAVALLVTWSPVGYRLVRHLVTLVHEAGHALVAALVLLLVAIRTRRRAVAAADEKEPVVTTA